MKRTIIIDGNNLIGKIPRLWNLQKKDRQASREGLVFLLERYFYNKKINVSLHFDGFANGHLAGKGIKITYSDNTIADNKIKDEIANSRNPKLLTVVSSDLNILEFARVNSCEIKKSEELVREIEKPEASDDEEKRAKEIDNNEMKKLFGIE